MDFVFYENAVNYVRFFASWAISSMHYNIQISFFEKSMQDLAGELRRIMANFDGDQFTDEDIAATIDWYNTTKTLDPDRFRISHKQSETHLQEHHRSHLRMLTRCYPEVDFSRVL